ncbi:MAG: hypothetical protein ABI573_10935 [Chloroflexota bacterium]
MLEVEALVTDRYLDSLLIEADLVGREPGPVDVGTRRWPAFLTAFLGGSDAPDPRQLDSGVRLASERLTRDLPRFHPSFRFEERLAVRLAEAAAAMRLPLAANGESSARMLALPTPRPAIGGDLVPQRDPDIARPRRASASDAWPLLVGAVAASALSLAGAAWVGWRRARLQGSPMARAARAAHDAQARSAHAMRGRPA